MKRRALLIGLAAAAAGSRAQVAPLPAEVARCTGLHAAAHRGDVAALKSALAAGAAVNGRDAYGRTPLHVATFARQREAVRALAAAGADLGALVKLLEEAGAR